VSNTATVTAVIPKTRSVYLYNRAGVLADELDARGYRTQKIIALLIGDFAEKFATIDEAVAKCQEIYQAWAQAHPDKQ
jgi:hypothetical protein